MTCCKDCFKGYRSVSNSSRNLRMDVLLILGGVCVRCGFDDIRALQIDHVNGGGNREVLELGHRARLYMKIRDGDSEGYQLLCANCNSIKRYEENELPRGPLAHDSLNALSYETPPYPTLRMRGVSLRSS